MSPPDGYEPGKDPLDIPDYLDRRVQSNSATRPERNSSGPRNAPDTPLEVTGPHFSDIELPDGAPRAHSELGKPSAVYLYRSSTGDPSCVIYRFDLQGGGKEYRPYNMILRAWKGLDTPRPLFGLECLSEANDIIFLVEGEKAANALRSAEFAATTCMNGANGLSKTDLSPLAGRSVIVWQDNDSPGRKFLLEAIAALNEIGAASIRVLPIDSYPCIEGDADDEARMLEFSAIAPCPSPLKLGHYF